MSLSAVLFYGYNLGSPENSGWEIEEEPDYGDFQAEWYEAYLESDEDESGDLKAHICRQILLASAVDVGDTPWYSLDDKVKATCGVEVLTYGHSNSEFIGIALAGTVTIADDWSPQLATCALPDPMDTQEGEEPIDPHEPLQRALEALGVTPNQGHPSWVVAPNE